MRTTAAHGTAAMRRPFHGSQSTEPRARQAHAAQGGVTLGPEQGEFLLSWQHNRTKIRLKLTFPLTYTMPL
jgi:hypothetical protein